MTPAQLTELGALCATSMKKANQFLDQVITLNPAQAVAAKTKRLYSVSVADLPGGTGLESIGKMMQFIGVGKEVRKLRKLHENSPPSGRGEHVSSERWVVDIETSKPHQHPDVQALACLRILQPNIFVSNRSWIARLTLNRLSALLVEYPALLHPSIVWQYKESQTSVFGELLPMAHVIALTGGISFPAPRHGVSVDDLMRFAVHPATALGIRARAHKIGRSSNAHNQGRTLGELFGLMAQPRVSLADSLLRIDRFRRDNSKAESLFGGATETSNGFRYLVSQSFMRSWSSPVESEVQDTFLTELKASPTLPGHSVPRLLVSEAARLFVDPARRVSVGATGAAVPPAAAKDPLERFDRMVANLVRVRAHATPAEAARAVLRELFPLAQAGGREPETGRVSTAASVVSVETATHFIDRWLGHGIAFEELVERLSHSQGDDSPWSIAVSIMETHRSMTDVIEAASSVAPAAAPPRRMRGL